MIERAPETAAGPSRGARSSARRRVVGLYAITPDDEDTERLVALVDAALDGGAAVVQYRNKTASSSLRRQQSARLAELVAGRGALYIVNDHPELALEAPGAGIHVGRDDADDVASLRERVGARIVGASCYGDVDAARRAVAAGADYVAFGSVFASATKPAAVAAPLAVFAAARPLAVPLVAIGGIRADNVAALAAAGADAVAVIADLFADRDPASTRERARRLVVAFESGRTATTTRTNDDPRR